MTNPCDTCPYGSADGITCEECTGVMDEECEPEESGLTLLVPLSRHARQGVNPGTTFQAAKSPALAPHSRRLGGRSYLEAEQ